MPDQNNHRWHVNKSISLGTIAFLTMQSVALVAWAVRLDSRVAALEEWNQRQEIRIASFENYREKLVIIEERQTSNLKRFEDLIKKVELVVEEVRAKK